MTFGLPSWLKLRFKELNYEVPVWYPSHDRPDHREWIVANGLGGYAASTVCGAHTRRYHGMLVASMREPVDRHVILSQVDELVDIDGVVYELATNHWASGVVSPTGYRLIESFTVLPAPTWVFNLDGHYLVKQLTMPRDTNQVYLGYSFLPDRDRAPREVNLHLRILAGFRNFHDQMRGFGEKCYVQSVSSRGSTVTLDGHFSRLHLAWSSGAYEPREQWWWGYHWPEEAARDLPDQEDLFLLGTITTRLREREEFSLVAGLNEETEAVDCRSAVLTNLKRQRSLLVKAGLKDLRENNLLVLSCDQFLVKRQLNGSEIMSVIAGYPWLNDCGRDAMVSLPGLTIATHRYDAAKRLLSDYSDTMMSGLMPERFPDWSIAPEYCAADTTLWWGWALYHYCKATRDKKFMAKQFPRLVEAAERYIQGTVHGIKVDADDGLLHCGDPAHPELELSWMNALVAEIPITPRSGKPVEMSALWFNFLNVLVVFAEELGKDTGRFQEMATLAGKSLQKFWNGERQCLYDVLEPSGKPAQPDGSVRPNQMFAVSLPFRAFTSLQEQAILSVVESELLTPVGLRSLSPTDPSYQGAYGCGFARADRYHRDLSYHQGTAWPWLMGAYCDALLNVFGPVPETFSKIRLILQPLIIHLMEDACLGSISEIFDGNSPHLSRGCFAQAWSVAETMRLMSLVLRHQ